MTIFDYIASILFTKNKVQISTIDTETDFSPYLLNRWISMYSPSCAKSSNLINKYIAALNKSELYSLFIAVFDRVTNKKISYFKKRKEEEKENIELIKKIANAKELSSREVKDYFKLLNYKVE